MVEGRKKGVVDVCMREQSLIVLRHVSDHGAEEAKSHRRAKGPRAVLARARGTENKVAGAGAIGAVFVSVGAAKAENTKNLMKGVAMYYSVLRSSTMVYNQLQLPFTQQQLT